MSGYLPEHVLQHTNERSLLLLNDINMVFRPDTAQEYVACADTVLMSTCLFRCDGKVITSLVL